MTPLRLFVVLAMLSPVAAVAIASWAAHPLTPVAAALAALIGSIIGLAPVLYLSNGKFALHQAAQEIRQVLHNDQEETDKLVAPLNDLTGGEQELDLIEILKEYGSRLGERRAQLRACMSAMMRLFGELADMRRPIPKLPAIETPDANDYRLLNGSYVQFAQNLLKTRRRAKQFAGFLRELPQAVIVTDQQLIIVSVNEAAERLLGRPVRQLQQRSLTRFFADPSFLEDADRYSERPITAEESIVELMCGKAEECVTTVHGPSGKIHCVAMRAKFGPCHTFSFRLIKPAPEPGSPEADGGQALGTSQLITIHS